MTIDALKSFSDEEASQILAQAVLTTLPSPSDPQSDQSGSTIVSAVLTELRTRLKIEDSDQSSKARAALQAELAKEMSARVLNDASRAAAINRASAAGRLGTGSYRVKFVEPFDKSFRPLGVRRSTVEKAIRDSDFEHHAAGDFISPTDTVFSFFLKRMPAKGVLPNSPDHTTSVSSSSPLIFRSFSKPAMGWSTACALFS